MASSWEVIKSRYCLALRMVASVSANCWEVIEMSGTSPVPLVAQERNEIFCISVESTVAPLCQEGAMSCRWV